MVERFMSPEEAARSVAGEAGGKVCAAKAVPIGSLPPALRATMIYQFVARIDRPYSWLDDYDMRNMAIAFLELLNDELERTGHRIVALTDA